LYLGAGQKFWYNLSADEIQELLEFSD